MIIEFLADGFEEVEALTPYDMLKRAGADIKFVSVTSDKLVHGAHGVGIYADEAIDFVKNMDAAEMVIFPGGMPGASNIEKCAEACRLAKATAEKGGHVAAICAAPYVLGRLGILEGKKATCYPGFEKELKGADVASTKDGGKVITSGNVTTASGMGVALPFGTELVSVLYGKDKANEILKANMPA